VEAAGYVVDVRVRPFSRSADALSGPVGRQVRQHRAELVRAAAAHGVRGLRVFGSVARSEESPDSDLDLMADLPAGLGLFGLGHVVAELEAILGGVRVDLVPASDLKPGVRERIERDLVEL
jgi:predicted nucleotidyltransferase